jgi:glycerol-3-phosphate dehydrogenase
LRRGRIRLSKAFNILINRLVVPDYAVGVYTKNRSKNRIQVGAKGSRLLFFTPWHSRSLVGTVHLPYDCDPDDCRVTEDEIEKFLSEINETYPAAALERNDICLTYSGLLPISSDVPGTLQLTRRYRILDHEKQDGIAGLISIMGVKLTEARHVAERTIDLVFAKLAGKSPKSATATTALHGGHIRSLKRFIAAELERKPPEVSSGVFQRVVQFYGSAFSEVLKYLPQECGLGAASGEVACAEKQSYSRGNAVEAQLAASLPPRGLGSQMDDGSLICAEIRHGIREEMAQTLSDVVFRRTTLALAGTPEEDSLTDAAAIMSTELGWDSTRKQREISETKMFLSART